MCTCASAYTPIHTHIPNPTHSDIYTPHPYTYTSAYTVNPHRLTHSHTYIHTFTFILTLPHPHTHTLIHTLTQKRSFPTQNYVKHERGTGGAESTHFFFICLPLTLKRHCCLLYSLTQTENTVSGVEQELSLFG